jgi:hypothetical protein
MDIDEITSLLCDVPDVVFHSLSLSLFRFSMLIFVYVYICIYIYIYILTYCVCCKVGGLIREYHRDGYHMCALYDLRHHLLPRLSEANARCV